MTIAPDKLQSDPTIDACAPCNASAILAAPATLEPQVLAARLESNYPLTVAALRQMEGGLVHLQYIATVEERWKRVAQGLPPTEQNIISYVPHSSLPETSADFDLVYCGGVLGLFSAAVMALRGYRVAVLDQRRVGTSHREWNISDSELEQFVRAGLFSRAELETAVAGRYTDGVVRFYSGNIPEPPAEVHLNGVLNVAMDLGKLLELARAKFSAAGGVVLDFRALKQLHISGAGVVRSVVTVENQAGGLEYFGARLVINALGAISPLSLEMQDGQPFDGVCPTVGTTARGFVAGKGEKQVDNGFGDVLVSVADAQQGRQLIWEGFPAANGEMTTYLFYYDLVKPELAQAQSLLDLFERYFELLPTYKDLRSDFVHLKPVYGYIPARHHRAQYGAVSQRGILSIGDAASPQSSLTFCGFGSQVRNLPRLTNLLTYALDNELLEAGHLRQIGAHQSNISMVWVFSRFMQPSKPGSSANDVNRILNVFCAALNRLGPDLTRRFFQDTFGWLDYNRLLLSTARHYPRVFWFTVQVLGWQGIGHWASDYLRFTRETLLRQKYSFYGQKGRTALVSLLGKLRPDWALWLKGRFEEWQASSLIARSEKVPQPHVLPDVISLKSGQ